MPKKDGDFIAESHHTKGYGLKKSQNIDISSHFFQKIHCTPLKF